MTYASATHTLPDTRLITHTQRALCEHALLTASVPQRISAFVHSHRGAELLALLGASSGALDYLTGALATPDGAKQLIKLTQVLTRATTHPRTAADLHALNGLAYLATGARTMAELHAGIALRYQPTHPPALRLMDLIRSNASPAEIQGHARRSRARTLAATPSLRAGV